MTDKGRTRELGWMRGWSGGNRGAKCRGLVGPQQESVDGRLPDMLSCRLSPVHPMVSMREGER